MFAQAQNMHEQKESCETEKHPQAIAKCNLFHNRIRLVKSILTDVRIKVGDLFDSELFLEFKIYFGLLANGKTKAFCQTNLTERF